MYGAIDVAGACFSGQLQAKGEGHRVPREGGRGGDRSAGAQVRHRRG